MGHRSRLLQLSGGKHSSLQGSKPAAAWKTYVDLVVLLPEDFRGTLGDPKVRAAVRSYLYVRLSIILELLKMRALASWRVNIRLAELDCCPWDTLRVPTQLAVRAEHC